MSRMITICGAFLVSSTLLASALPAAAQYTDSPVTTSAQISCTRDERYGQVTDHTAWHAHEIVLNLTSAADNQYVYSGYAQNGKNGGGSGESVDAVYSAATGKLLNETPGLTCPVSIVP